jgi:hypothetical protein
MVASVSFVHGQRVAGVEDVGNCSQLIFIHSYVAAYLGISRDHPTEKDVIFYKIERI